jgi:hypothetical protein
VVPGNNPVTELINVPVPVPSIVFDPEIAGSCVVAQQTPRAVIDAPPSEVIFPSKVAVVEVNVTLPWVVRTGNAEFAVKLDSVPYAVPTLLVAYPL